MSTPTFSGSDLLEMLEENREYATRYNMLKPVVLPDGSIVRMEPGRCMDLRGNAMVTTTSGKTRSWRCIFMDPEPGSTLIKFHGDSYGSGLVGCDIRVNPYEASDITAIETDSKTKNAIIEHCRFEHRGKDVLGLRVAGHESLTVNKCEFRCSVPLVLRSGDNHVFRDMDIGTAVTEEQREQWHSGKYPCTCIWYQGMPDQHSFEGSFTAQGGDHLVYGIVDRAISGQVLALRNIRWEQPLSRLSEEKRAIHLEFTNRHLERLILDGVRWTDRTKGYYIKGCLRVDEIGSWIPGTKWYRKKTDFQLSLSQSNDGGSNDGLRLEEEGQGSETG